MVFVLAIAAAPTRADGPPEHLRPWATLTTDGRYVLELAPAQRWSSAEISVTGAASQDVGPAGPEQPMRIEGWTHAVGTLTISVMAVDAEGRGTTWLFTVDPEVLPATIPDMSGEPIATSPWWWPF